MNKKIARINSRLYFDLFERGGDRLIAVYAILKTSRNGEIKYYSYTAKNNKFIGGYSLLRAKTNLTLHTIEKYVPTLMEMGLCFIDNNGDFVMLGNEKVKELYNNRKLVPIVIGKNITETAYNVVSVRLFSAEKQQLKQIEVKQNRSELLKQASNPSNPKLYKKAKRALKKYEGVDLTVIDKTVLSNQGFAVLKDGTVNNKSKGAYWKKVLKRNGVVKTNRRFEPICEMPYAEYLQIKNSGYKAKKHTFNNGFLSEELVSSFSSIDLINKKS